VRPHAQGRVFALLLCALGFTLAVPAGRAEGAGSVQPAEPAATETAPPPGTTGDQRNRADEIRPFFDQRIDRRGSANSRLEVIQDLPDLMPDTTIAVQPSTAAAEPYAPPESPADLLAMTDEMRAFFSSRIDPKGTIESQLDRILSAILTKSGLGFAYEADGNYSAAETFRRRRGNCISFAFLFLAAARASGCRASFNEVSTYPQWDQLGSLVAEVRHVNVIVFDGPVRFEVDLQPLVERLIVPGTTRLISDDRAFAEFYSNLGVAHLARDEREEALRLLHFATTVDPSCAVAWSNLGSAYSVLGDPASARVSLERAVKEKPWELAALNGLARVYARTGQIEKAAKLEKRVKSYREKNPYYHLALAKADFAAGRFAEADARLKKAISLKDDEPEFYRLRIDVARQLGREADARRWTAKLLAAEGMAPVKKLPP
jgi:Flp pilus assembly protein TadD